MSTILEELKERLEAAKLRTVSTQLKFIAAQADNQAALTDVTVWTNAVNAEMREQERLAAEADEKQMPLPQISIEPRPITASAIIPIPQPIVDDQSGSANATDSVNQADLVRDLLRERGVRMAPNEIWNALEGKISSRAYLYSILKRMRDKDEITKYRNKYSIKPKPVEVKRATEMPLLK